ncbi:MAG TPA: rRNA maturation RNase YbeY [Blastocatellia bacterium]|nr:rRNA maturation RNase YbeY [Blastocatellia bacterium]
MNRQRRVRITSNAIAELADATLAALGRSDNTVTVAFVRDPAIRRLNRSYRGKDRATDVLSFSAGESEVTKDGENGRYLGDVVISTDTALAQAAESSYTIDRELAELVIHGVLHLCGYDHETDRGEMTRLERKLRHRLLDRRTRS